MRLIGKLLAKAMAVLSLLFASTVSMAEDATQDTEGTLLAKAYGRFKDPLIEAERLNLVAAFERYCGELKKVFPTNSPSEDDWIWREIEGSSDRAFRALASKEWAKFEAEKFTSRCLEATQIYKEKPEFRTHAIFLLIEAASNYAPDAERGARLNGVDPTGWNFLILGSSATRVLTRIGVTEANLLYQAAYVGGNVGK